LGEKERRKGGSYVTLLFKDIIIKKGKKVG